MAVTMNSTGTLCSRINDLLSTFPVERAKVLFSYVAENEDELSITEGEIITILEKELEDSGWWKGEINGKVGVFPDNFVDLLPPEEVKPKKPPPPSISKPAAPEVDRPRPTTPASDSKPKQDEKKPAPALPTKKPAMPPPPISKKPLGSKHSSDLIAQTDDHKVKESQKESGIGHAKLANPTPTGRSGKPSTRIKTEEIDLDIVPTAEPLTHPNANRAKAPSRRPPTIHNRERSNLVKVEPQTPESPEQEEVEPEDPPPPGPAPPIPEFPDSPRLRDAYARRSHRRAQQKAELQKHTMSLDELLDPTPGDDAAEAPRLRGGAMSRPAPPLPKNEPPPSPTPPRTHAPHNDDTDAVNGAETGRAVIDLRQELEVLKASTVPRAQYESLEKEVVHLREMTNKLEKLTTVLMNDIDEGAKERRSMQVEIDRIRKLSLLPGTQTS